MTKEDLRFAFENDSSIMIPKWKMPDLLEPLFHLRNCALMEKEEQKMEEQTKDFCYHKRIEIGREENPFLPIHAIVRDILRERIVTCDLAPGYRLKEVELADEIGVSRTTVRNALDALLAEGLLEKEGKRGLCVGRIPRAQCNQLREFRRLIDPIAAGLAATRRTMQDLAEMRRFMEACKSEDAQTFCEADSNFHYTIYVAAKNLYFLSAYDRIHADRKRVNYVFVDHFSKTDTWQYLTSKRDRMRESHAAILDAIERSDEAAARELASKHIELSLLLDVDEC